MSCCYHQLAISVGYFNNKHKILKNVTEYILCHLRHSSSSWVRTSLVMLPTVEITPLPIRDMLTNHSTASTSWPITVQFFPSEDFSYIMMCPMLHKWSVFTAWLLQNNFSNSDLFTSAEVSLELSVQHFYCQHNISVLSLWKTHSKYSRKKEKFVCLLDSEQKHYYLFRAIFFCFLLR